MMPIGKKIIASICAAGIIISGGILFTGCTEAERVRYNLAEESDNFNCIRRITVINCITNDTIMTVQGRCSIKADTTDNQLEIIIEYDEDKYMKNIIGLADNVTYLLEDLEPTSTDKYQYEINWNPKMWIPFQPDYID